MTVHAIDTDKNHTDFVALVALLDEQLVATYGADVMENFCPFNTLDGIIHAVVVYCDDVPCACGGIKRFDADSVEIKRVFVKPAFRRLGLGGVVIQRLEEAAMADGYKRAVLETAADMTAAQALYKKRGYTRISNYAPYENNPLSVCFEKHLTV